MPQRILGLDIGAWSVKAVLLEDRFRGFQVVSAHEKRVEPPKPTSEDSDEEVETLQQRQLTALRELLLEQTEKVDAYGASLPGEQASVRFVNSPFSDARKVEQTIAGELADILPFDVDEAIFDHEILRKTDEGSIVLAASARFPVIEKRLEMLSEAEADPKYLSVDTLDLYNLYTHFLKDDGSKAESPGSPAPEAGTFISVSPDAPPDARLIVDIGHERTIMCAAGEDGIAYVRAVRTGGADVTRALMSAADVDFEDAEFIKHEEGFIASGRHPAPDERAHQISENIVSGLSTLIRELRRSLQAIRSEKKVRIARVDLVGGGSRIRNLANYLADQLNVPTQAGLAVEQIVERDVEQPRRSAFSVALATALRTVGDAEVSQVDLRKGDFQFAGQLQHLRTRIPTIMFAAFAIILLLGVNVIASYRAAITREATIDRQFCTITKEVVGREICEPKIAIQALKNPATEFGNVEFPSRSALNIAAELSARIPEKLEVKIREMQISPNRAKVSGEATSYDAVDQIVGEYAKDPCYSEIKKGKLRRLADGNRIEFLLSMNLGCS